MQPQLTGLGWFRVISRTPIGGVLALCRDVVGVFYSPSWLGQDCLVSYPGHLLGESYSSAEMQLVCSAAPADWVSDVTVQYVNHFTIGTTLGVLGITLNCTWCWGSNSGDLENGKYPFFAIPPRSTLTQSGSACSSPICGSNRFICKLFVLDRNTCYHITMSNNIKKLHLKCKNKQCTQFPNLSVWNNPRLVDMPV